MTTLTITKHEHACLSLAGEDQTILIDPGVFNPTAGDLLARADAVLITHDHPDHLDAEAVRAAYAARPSLVIVGSAAVAEALGADVTITVLEPGQSADAAGLPVYAVGGTHAPIHADLPLMSNLGYVVGEVYHPGDSYHVPTLGTDQQIDTLLVPTSGPWAKLSEAADFIRAIGPRRSVQIHDGMLNDVGRAVSGDLLGAEGLTGVPMLSPAPGSIV